MNDVPVREVLLVDDDEVSRELLMLFVAEAGFQGISAESGDRALEKLAELQCRPFAVIADMHMDGITGNALARELRRLCGDSTRLIAISGSGVKPQETQDFDGFLLKPLSVDQLWVALEEHPTHPPQETQAVSDSEALNETTFASLARSMPLEQLLKLYSMCLEDAERRIARMRLAAQSGDAAEYERGAHAIKGGCGMVGAVELAGIAAAMEENGLPPGGNLESLEQFLVALARLRRILDARVV